MLFGHNTNVKAGDTTYHVQTEDRGVAHALIDTTVYFRGRVLHRRTNNYFDLLPLNAEREQALKLRVDEQHRTIVEQIQSGALSVALPPEEKPAVAPIKPPSTVAPAPASAPPAAGLKLELINPRTWLTGKRALLQIVVRDHADRAMEGAIVTAKVDGAAVPAEFSTVTGGFGHAQFEFDMPPLAHTDAALVVEAFKGNNRGHLRFQLKMKPRVPSAS
ncbi:MAG TPA: hypothetical protein VJO16_06090 [Candidatus Acidoferrum sp.]|nr:hypothetical protein [Candidatus Acidoferrum sp.]